MLPLLLSFAELAAAGEGSSALWGPTIGSGNGGSLPVMNVQRFHAAADGFSLWTDSAAVGRDHRFGVRAVASYAYRPLIYVDPSGYVLDLVGNVAQLDLLAGYTVGPLRFAVDAPVYLRQFGGIASDSSDIGDVAADVKVQALDAGRNPLGLAFAGRLLFPTSTTPGLSAGGFGGETTLILDGNIGPAQLAANLGAAFRPASSLENANWPAIAPLARLGLSVPVSDSAGLTLDVNTEIGLGGALWDGSESDIAATTPAEALIGGWGQFGNLRLQGAVGTALSSGIGAPQARGILGIQWAREPILDADADGLNDKSDACPRLAEDTDKFEDTDGCPEPTTISLTFVDAATGLEIPGVVSGIAGREAKNSRVLSLNADAYALVASAPGYETTKVMVDVPGGEPTQKIIKLNREVARGHLVIHVVDDTGRPIEATLSVPGTPTDRPTAAFDRLVPSGSVTVGATRSGYVPVTQIVSVSPEATVEITIKMFPDIPASSPREK